MSESTTQDRDRSAAASDPTSAGSSFLAGCQLAIQARLFLLIHEHDPPFSELVWVARRHPALFSDWTLEAIEDAITEELAELRGRRG